MVLIWRSESTYGRPFKVLPLKKVSDKSQRAILFPATKSSPKMKGSSVTTRYSTGHKLGFNYDPKVINSGVDLKTARTLVLPNKCSAIFSSNLINGAAINLDSKIRFSVDFQVIRNVDYSVRNTKFHFSSGKHCFTFIEPW